MVFSEPKFLFFFLPLVVIGYFVLPSRLRNAWLLAASLAFYAIGERVFLIVLVGVVALNFVWGLLLGARSLARWQCWIFAAGIGLNLSVLIFFKYSYFLAVSLIGAERVVDFTENIHLPLGISFYVFQSLSYLIDIRRDVSAPQRNPLRLALYVSLFPQLVAGPIVRYDEIEDQLTERQSRLEDMVIGTRRFIVGLAKKVLLADPLGQVADQIFALPTDSLSTGTAWVGVVCYTLQIFFDFSAYSDMAIGIGRIFGFRFPENFNFPYIAMSVTDFWRRWHMTLSRFFRDYLYIPLGGNRAGPTRTYANLWIVFLLCGLWHGASWNFVIWGAYYGAFLVAERLGLEKALGRVAPVGRHFYLILVVMIGWVPFRAETLGDTGAILGAMFWPTAGDPAVDVVRYLTPYLVFLLVAGGLFATPFHRQLLGGALIPESPKAMTSRSSAAVFIGLLLLAIIAVGASSYSPFIYFRF